jgi:hypothetical protein
VTRDQLAARIHAFLDDPARGEPITALMLEVHRWQRAHDPVLASLTVAEPASIEAIPAVPVGIWKDLPVGTVGADEPAVVFHTSGTTGGGRGTHRLRDTGLYDRNALLWAHACLGDWQANVVALLDDAPDSSLGHMTRLFGDVAWYARNGVVDAERARAHLADGRPAFVATTAFALAEYLEGAPPPLPAGSTLMVTGGFKGRVHKLDGDALLAATRATLRPDRLVTEYGMTELSSQLWGTPGTAFRAPPWLVAVAADPVSGRALPRGERGQLRFYDLCNLDSTLGVETMDEGTVTDAGVVLHGRLPGAPARGCSLTVEEAWQKR